MTSRFDIYPGGGAVLIFSVILGAILLGLVLMFVFICLSTRLAWFEVSPAGVQIHGAMYGRKVPMDQIDVESVRAVDLSQDRDYGLKWRTNGIGMPGFAAGWFRTNNGKKCLAFITNPRSAVLIPTKGDYCVLLSTAKPREMVLAIQEAAR